MTDHTTPVPAEEALARLKAGNEAFLDAAHNPGALDQGLRSRLAASGQHPYAAVLACADSRVVPEHVFMAGLGDLFTIRVAGNIAGDTQVGSVAYAAGHLGVRLVVVMGHTNCGAVGAVLEGGAEGSVRALTDVIEQAIGEERDSTEAARMNVEAAVARISADPEVARLARDEGLVVTGCLYDVATGEVRWL